VLYSTGNSGGKTFFNLAKKSSNKCGRIYTKFGAAVRVTDLVTYSINSNVNLLKGFGSVWVQSPPFSVDLIYPDNTKLVLLHQCHMKPETPACDALCDRVCEVQVLKQHPLNSAVLVFVLIANLQLPRICDGNIRKTALNPKAQQSYDPSNNVKNNLTWLPEEMINEMKEHTWLAERLINKIKDQKWFSGRLIAGCWQRPVKDYNNFFYLPQRHVVHCALQITKQNIITTRIKILLLAKY